VPVEDVDLKERIRAVKGLANEVCLYLGPAHCVNYTLNVDHWEAGEVSIPVRIGWDLTTPTSCALCQAKAHAISEKRPQVE
jgi:hypothetical protein